MSDMFIDDGGIDSEQVVDALESDSESLILHADATKSLSDFPDKSVDCVVTSPPYYNVSKSYTRGEGVHYTKDVGEPLYTIVDVSEALYDVVSDDGFYCMNMGFSYSETGVMRPFRLVERILKTGWFVADVVIWHKTNPMPLKNRLENSFEYIFIFSKNPNPTYPEVDYKHNHIETSVANISHEKISAPFPEEVPEYLIETFSEEGDTVVDPFVGSGTTGVVCEDMERGFVGLDINREYCEFARERVNEAADA